LSGDCTGLAGYLRTTNDEHLFTVLSESDDPGNKIASYEEEFRDDINKIPDAEGLLKIDAMKNGTMKSATQRRCHEILKPVSKNFIQS
jgi:hypothetical protein